jgi:uncharacterized membrane protein
MMNRILIAEWSREDKERFPRVLEVIGWVVALALCATSIFVFASSSDDSCSLRLDIWILVCGIICIFLAFVSRTALLVCQSQFLGTQDYFQFKKHQFSKYETILWYTWLILMLCVLALLIWGAVWVKKAEDDCEDVVFYSSIGMLTVGFLSCCGCCILMSCWTFFCFISCFAK